MRRRHFIQQGGALLSLSLIGCTRGTNQPGETGSPSTDTGDTGPPADIIEVSEVPFETPLTIPAEYTGEVINGQRVFKLSMQEGQFVFFPGQSTATMGYNGTLLGPTLRARRGDSLRIEVQNNLPMASTTHWHGAHLPASADGGPHQIIEPGATWVSEWVVNQRGCTNWYHPHLEGETAFQVYHGLAGLFYLDDDENDALNLPSRYGVDDLPIVLQDRRFTGDGALEYDLSFFDKRMGFQGDTVLVNGAIQPHHVVEAKELRLRVLNGSNARVLRLAFHDDSSFLLIGGDNSLFDEPVSVNQVVLSPGERVELVIDLGGRLGESIRCVDLDGEVELFELRVEIATAALTPVPATLLSLSRLNPNDSITTRTFTLSMSMGMQSSGFTINGASMDIDVINEIVPLDQVEIWEFRNTSMMNHSFHMHATHFEVLTRDGAAPEPHERGYKDTVLVGMGQTVRVLLKHVDYADPNVPYMYHCHILEHEDQGMMGQFTVVNT